MRRSDVTKTEMTSLSPRANRHWSLISESGRNYVKINSVETDRQVHCTKENGT